MSESPSENSCPYKEKCSGCSHFDRSAQEEAQIKIETLKIALRKLGIFDFEINYLRAPENGFRNRIDLQVRGGILDGESHLSGQKSEQKIGLLSQKNADNPSVRELINIESCLMLEPGLNELLMEIQKLHFPIQKGSLRLRYFAGKKGIWLDFSNKDIHGLLEQARGGPSEKSLLAQLLKLGLVEIGQRRKRLTHQFKLVDPVLDFWSETFLPMSNAQEKNLSDFSSLPLLSTIAGFSQPGSASNLLLIQEALQLSQKFLFEPVISLDSTPRESFSWVEFGAGNGNLTFPFAKRFPADTFLALEYDDLSLLGLEETKDKFNFKNIMFQSGDFQKNQGLALGKFDRILLNPPRSGVGAFLDPLHSLKLGARPSVIIYVSCYLDSFSKDLSSLLPLGYSLAGISIVDQFPHTEHFEIVAVLKLQS